MRTPRRFGSGTGAGTHTWLTGGGQPGGGHWSALSDILTDEQQEQAEQIRESFRSQMEVIREQLSAGDLSAAQAHQRLTEIREAIRDQIQAILTDEQRVELETRRAEREAARAARHAAAKVVRDEVLDLDTAASAALDAILAEFRDSALALHEELLEASANETRAHSAMQALREDQDAQVSELLDEVGFEIFRIHDAMRHRVRGIGSGPLGNAGPAGPTGRQIGFGTSSS